MEECQLCTTSTTLFLSDMSRSVAEEQDLSRLRSAQLHIHFRLEHPYPTNPATWNGNGNEALNGHGAGPHRLAYTVSAQQWTHHAPVPTWL